jgi:hypothetical protein
MRRRIWGMEDQAALTSSDRPADPAELRAEVRRLATQQRLSASDIGAALQLSMPQVREMLAATSQEAAEMHAQAWKSVDARL